MFRFWMQALKHAFTKAWIGVCAVSGVFAVLVPCARLLFTQNQSYQAFLDILERYWVGWLLIVVFFLVLLGRVAYAPYLIYRDVRRKYDEISNIKRQERHKAVKECFEQTALILKREGRGMSFHAFVRAGGCDLESNEEIVQASNLVKASGHHHPFEGISPGHVPEKDLLDFMRHIKFAPNIKSESGTDYLEAANQWRHDHGYPLPRGDENFAV